MVTRNWLNHAPPPAPASSRNTMNCRAETNSRAEGNCPSSRAFLTRRSVGCSVLPLRSGIGVHSPNACCATRQAPRLNRAKTLGYSDSTAARTNRAVSILAGKASESSCNCAFSRYIVRHELGDLGLHGFLHLLQNPRYDSYNVGPVYRQQFFQIVRIAISNKIGRA